MRALRGPVVLLVAAALLVVGLLASLRIGARPLTWAEVWAALTGGIDGDPAFIVRDLRLPRVLLAAAVGGSLAVAGAAMQAVTQNPLASPSIAGLSGGGTLAVLIAVLVAPTIGPLGLMGASLFGAGVAAAIVFSITHVAGGAERPERLALAGIMVSTLLGAITTMLVFENQLGLFLVTWLLGGFAHVGWTEVIAVTPVMVGLVGVLGLAGELTVLGLGRQTARALGQRAGRVQALAMFAVLLLAGSAVAVAGPVAFVGLFVPHIARRLVGLDYRWILPVSALLGALFVVGADAASRTLGGGAFDLPAGVFSTLIGLPFFLVVVRIGGRRRSMA